MLSKSIYNSIISCQQVIDNINTTIRELHYKIEEQQYVLDKFMAKANGYYFEHEDFKSRCNNVISYCPVAVFSERMNEKSEIELGIRSESMVDDAMENIKDMMRKEINYHRNVLEQQIQELSLANIRMSQLRIDHANALQSEKEDGF